MNAIGMRNEELWRLKLLREHIMQLLIDSAEIAEDMKANDDHLGSAMWDTAAMVHSATLRMIDTLSK